MQDAIINKLSCLTELARTMELRMWTGAWGESTTDEVLKQEIRQIAEQSLEATILKIERCRRVLRLRYGYHAE